MYIGHARLCVCVSLAAFPYYCTDPDVTWGNGRRCPIVMHYCADLQSLHGFRCYDNIAPNAKCQRVRVLVLALCLVVILSDTCPERDVIVLVHFVKITKVTHTHTHTHTVLTAIIQVDVG